MPGWLRADFFRLFAGIRPDAPILVLAAMFAFKTIIITVPYIGEYALGLADIPLAGLLE